MYKSTSWGMQSRPYNYFKSMSILFPYSSTQDPMIQILYQTIEKYWAPRPKSQRRVHGENAGDSQQEETDQSQVDTETRHDDDLGDHEVASQLGVALLAPPVGVVTDSQVPDSLVMDGQVMDIDLIPELAIPTGKAPNDPDKLEMDSQDDSQITPTEIEKTPPPAERTGASGGSDVVEVLESPPEKEVMSKDPVLPKQAFNESNLYSVQAQIALLKLLG